jgi:glycyl-tRNA synthetase beta chain
VTALVEWPVALTGNFERRFLAVPAEALISTMQDNQRYFPVVDTHGRLLPHFITIANIESRDPAQVRAGNERVIRPRFSDAEFFWDQDRKQPLAARMEGLKHVVFQQRLGTVADKSDRVAALARLIAGHSHGNPDWAERAARLAKCDLLTQMVQEFPELQGIMGRYYALHDKEAPDVAQALEEQYLPRFAGDRLPQTATGRALALAERLDTLTGIFAIGQGPSGARDPFALRRAALGVLRILIEGRLDLDLLTLLERAAAGFEPAIRADSAVETVFEFVMDRLRGYYLDQGVRPDTFEAVLDCRPTRPLDLDRRVRAVSAFRELPEAASLAAANKRIRNILKKVDTVLPFEVRTDLLADGAEQALAGRLVELSSEVVPLMEAGLYGEALDRLTSLREPVDAFFDQVLVMAEDPALRDNRLALLNELGSLFLRVADFSRLQD